MEEEVFFEKAYHVNKFAKDFNLESEENAHVLDELLITMEGSILGVKSRAIQPYLLEKEVRSIRMGVKKMPKKFEVHSEEDFFRMLAILTPLSETL